jgi:hypothetical protein
MIPDQFTNNVPGTLSEDHCRRVFDLASEVGIDDGALVVGDNSGRAVISAALAYPGPLIAWDSFSNRAGESTFPGFMNRIRTYGVFQRVVPVVHSIHLVGQVLLGRAYKLVVAVVSSEKIKFLDCLLASIESAKYTVAADGHIVFHCAQSGDAHPSSAVSTR